MAKSLRSKPKLRAKSLKRKGEFEKYVDARNKRLAEKMDEETKKQEELKKAAKEAETVEEDGEKMAVDGAAEKKKVSTSGWRDSRKQQYKQKKLQKKKTMKF